MTTKVELVEDWQEIDGLATGDIILSVRVRDEYIALSEFIRYGTPWIGESPEFVSTTGEKVRMSGFTAHMYWNPIFIELDNSGNNVRVWRAV